MSFDNVENIFITVNYNNSKVTIDYVERLEDLNVLIIVVDNNSSQNDFIKLEKKLKFKKKVIVIKNKENIGYFKGLNTGLNYIKKNNLRAKFVTVGNNDLVFETDYLDKLKQIDYQNNVLAIVPDVYTLENIHQNPHVIEKVSATRKLFYKLYFVNYYLGDLMMKVYKKFKKNNKNKVFNQEMNIYMGIGALYILTEHFFEHYDKLDDDVFLWGEEALFGNQVRSADGVILYTPNIKVKHLESLTTKKIPTKTKYKQMQKSFKIYSKFL